MTKPKPPELHQKRGPKPGCGRKPLPPEQLHRWTLFEILQRCVVSISDCWVWRCKPGAPETYRRYVMVRHGGERIQVRRLAYLLMFGKLPPSDKNLVPAKCLNPRCLNPAHQRPVSESEKCLVAVARGTFRTEEHARAIAKGKQAQAGRLPGGMEMARKIRAWKGSSTDFPEPLPISKSLFNRIRRNEAWKEWA